MSVKTAFKQRMNASTLVQEADVDLSDVLSSLKDEYRELDKAYGHINIEKLQELVAKLKGRVDDGLLSSLEYAISQFGLGRLMERVDRVRIEVEQLLKPAATKGKKAKR